MWRRSGVGKYRGGVCISNDGGKTWTKSNDGMEQTGATFILLDPTSPLDSRTLYVTGFGRGVYKSTNGGKSWTLKNTGITQKEPFAWRISRDNKGTLYLLFSRRSEDGSIGTDKDGALYRSTDRRRSLDARRHARRRAMRQMASQSIPKIQTVSISQRGHAPQANTAKAAASIFPKTPAKPGSKFSIAIATSTTSPSIPATQKFSMPPDSNPPRGFQATLASIGPHPRLQFQMGSSRHS